MTYLFAIFSGKDAPFYFPGMPFAFAALLVAVGLIFAYKTLRKY